MGKKKKKKEKENSESERLKVGVIGKPTKKSNRMIEEKKKWYRDRETERQRDRETERERKKVRATS